MIFALLAGIVEAVVMVAEVVVAVCTAIEAVARIQKFLNPDEDSVSLGGRLCEADARGIKREEFDTQREYMDAVRQLKVDQKALEKFDDKARRLRFLQEYQNFLNENPGADSSPFRFVMREAKGAEIGREAGLLHENSDWLRVYAEVFNSREIDLEKVSDYLEGRLPFEEVKQVDEAIREAERRLSPEKTDDEIRSFVENLKQKRRS
ncbi:MAG: hypothetical protein HQM09_14445 [Candidatus Riflebacteria bacterium]|nr:hypothetical protein [Candidatus Riflebacteria bacterium]